MLTSASRVVRRSAAPCLSQLLRQEALMQSAEVQECASCSQIYSIIIERNQTDTSCSSSQCLLPFGQPGNVSTRLFSAGAQPGSKQHNQRRLMGWAPDQMYGVIADVEQYHKFVPWCQGSRIKTRSQDGAFMTAELEVGFQMLRERYTSHVQLQPPLKVSSCVKDSMLFHHLNSSWKIEPGPVPNTCWLSFHVDFAFNNALYGHLADVFFSEVVKRMVGAFEGRCQHLHGPSSLVRPVSKTAPMSK